MTLGKFLHVPSDPESYRLQADVENSESFCRMRIRSASQLGKSGFGEFWMQHSCAHLLFFIVYVTKQLGSALTFVENPALMGVIYTPPRGAGDLVVTCSMQSAAKISFRSADGMIYEPGNGDLNITRVSEKKIVLYVRNDDVKAFDTLTSRDRGSFRCHAQDVTTLKVNSTGEFRFQVGEEPTTILSHSPSLTELFLGESDSLFCVTSIIRPPVSAAWEFQSGNSKPAQQISKNKTRELADAAKLELTTFLDLDGRKEDNGTYLCIFRNVFGLVSTVINVIVKYLDLLKISVNPTSHRVVENNNVSVFVQVDSNPAPRNISIILHGVVKKFEANRKTLDYDFKANVFDAGTYVVRVVHVSGIVQETFDLTVLSLPSRVQFFIQKITHNSVTYNWTVGMDGNADITRITLCCGESANDVGQNQCSASAKSQDVLTSFRSSDTLEGLLPNTTYYCELFAMNEVGQTPTGSPQIITTESTVPSKPNITSCVSRHETSLTVNWTTSNGGSAVKRYLIRYQIVEGSIQLAELSKQSKYRVEVAGENSVGTSLFGQTQNGECLTTCDLLAPIQSLSRSLVALKGGYAVQLFVEDRCGNATEFVSKSCAEKPLKTDFVPLTRQMFWVNITGVEMDQHCIMIKAITDNGVSSKYATIEITLRRESNSADEIKTVAISVTTAVLASCLVVALTVFLYRRFKRGQVTRQKNKKPKDCDHTGKRLPATGPLYEEVELNAVKQPEAPMQDSRAYGILPQARDETYLVDSPAYARVQAKTS
ncbi:cell adhesion molecule DSCAM-like isoform X2 [Oscarella lobularis]|uniref:cell adhesion molecule DSCAM-like isoform X2 n=1 Tax=Oscarella lobularis TaxID=121494 RepID=UPI0033139A1A